MQCLVSLKSDPDASIPYIVSSRPFEVTDSQIVERMLQSFLWQSKASKIDGGCRGVRYVTSLLHDKAMYMQ